VVRQSIRVRDFVAEKERERDFSLGKEGYRKR
jgi:hypothetical protein